jgi:hypothetical protein
MTSALKWRVRKRRVNKGNRLTDLKAFLLLLFLLLLTNFFSFSFAVTFLTHDKKKVAPESWAPKLS